MSQQFKHEPSQFGYLLKAWRKHRRVSQLDLAFSAGISQRHISFIESGRSNPSRSIVLKVASTLRLPAAETNNLLRSAGYTGVEPVQGWDPEIQKAIEASIEYVLKQHNPYPAVAKDRLWNLRSVNEAAAVLFAHFGTIKETNFLRCTFKPGPIRDSIVNWPALASELLRLLDVEISHHLDDPDGLALVEELNGYPGVASARKVTSFRSPSPVLFIHMKINDADLKLFTLAATIGMARDIRLDELRIETWLPADEPTREWFQQRNSV